MKEIDKVTRVEVIDKTGRAYTAYNVGVVVSVQDEGRTLKLFLTEKT